MTNSDLYFPFKWQIFQLICLPLTDISWKWNWDFPTIWMNVHFEMDRSACSLWSPQSGKNHIHQSSRDGGGMWRGQSVTHNLIRMLRIQMHAQTMKKRKEHWNIERNVFHTCQNMLSIVLPKKPSLVSEETSLGPNIVINSSKSTCPSPASRREHTC